MSQWSVPRCSGCQPVHGENGQQYSKGKRMQNKLLIAGLATTLLCAAGLLSPCSHGQQSQPLSKQFLEYKTKAEQDDASAQNNLGDCYYDGRGAVTDYQEAAKWYRQAADQNDATAQANLAVCYHEGQGVPKDEVEAYAWHNLAVRTSEEAAKHRDALAETLSPKQVAEGKKRTEELRAQIEAKRKRDGK